MLFSIIIPVYNVEKYLDECLNSILNQTEQDFEVILVNDGSADGSGQICNKYAKDYPDKIQVYHQENRGPLLARKLGITKACGDFCIFVDSDDYLRLDTLQIVKETIIKHDCDMVIYKYLRVNKNGRLVGKKLISRNKEEVFVDQNKEKLYSILLGGAQLNSMGIKASKRSLIDIDGDYTTLSKAFYLEDLMQTLPIITNAKKIVCLDMHLYYYRINPKSTTQSFNPHTYHSIKMVRNEVKRYLHIWNLEKCYEDIFYQASLKSINLSISPICWSDCTWNKKQKNEYLMGISNDDFFLESYVNTKKKTLDLSSRFFHWLIYRRYFIMVLFVINVHKIIAVPRQNIKKIIKKYIR